jgi:hypothetical protein
MACLDDGCFGYTQALFGMVVFFFAQKMDDHDPAPHFDLMGSFCCP